MKIELDHLISVLETLTPLAKAVPEPIGGPLEGALEATSRILKYAKEVKTNKEDSKELAQDAVSWVRTLTTTLDGLEANPAELAGLRGQVVKIFRVLASIETSMQQQSEQSWTRRSLNKTKDADMITKLRRELRSAFDEFITQSQLRLQAGQIHLKRIAEASNQKLEVLLSASDRATLNQLHPVGAARWDSRVSPSACLKDTRVDVLGQLVAWIRLPSSRLSVYWLTGLAGTGKSTIAKSFCEQLANPEESFFLTTFFISKTSEDRRDPFRILHTLVFDLATTYSVFRASILDSLAISHDIKQRPLKEQIEHLLVKPINACQVITEGTPLIIIIDALDESFGAHGVEGAAFVLALASALQVVPVKLLVTSRMETALARAFDRLPEHVLKLHEMEKMVIAGDTERILTQGFRDIVVARPHHFTSVDKPWPNTVDIETLVTRTGPLIVYATTLLSYIGDRRFPPLNRLRQILDLQDHSQFTSAFASVDSLYLSILQAAAQDRHGAIDDYLCVKLQHLVSALCVVKRPLSVAALSALLTISSPELIDDVEMLASVLLFSGNEPISEASVIRIFHQSFQDFALHRATDTPFSVDHTSTHHFMALRCLEVLNKDLHEDICHIKDHAIAKADIREPVLEERLQKYVPDLLQYACMYWPTHVQAAGDPTTELLEELDRFIGYHLLHWIELLSLLNEVSHAIISLSHLLRWLQQDALTTMLSKASDQTVAYDTLRCVRALLHDTLRALQTYDSMLATHALHVYRSLFVTMPECVLLDMSHGEPDFARLITPRAERWPSEQYVLRGHGGFVNCVAFSNDGSRVVSCSNDKIVHVWDVQSGRQVVSLEGHSQSVTSAAFSPDGAKIASGSEDQTVRIWDVPNGTLISTLEGHSRNVTSVAFSPDGTKIASGSNDHTVRIWDADNGTLISILEGHGDGVTSVAFSRDGTKIVSGSYDQTARIWDADHVTLVSRLRARDCWMTCVAFSPDGAKLASGSSDQIVRIWDTESCNVISTLLGHCHWVTSVAFSPDGAKVASASEGTIVQVWDANIGIVILKLAGHSEGVKSVSFSPDGFKIASGSYDKTVRIWDANNGSVISILEGHSCWVTSVSFSPDGTKIASASDDETVRIWYADHGTLALTLEGRNQAVTSVSFSPDGTQIASASNDETVRIWYADNGTLVLILDGHSQAVTSIAFSPDGTKIASGSQDETVRIWNVSNGTLLSVLEGHYFWMTSVAFSPDGTKIASGLSNNTVRIWDADVGTLISPLEGHSHHAPVTCVAFSPDGAKIASISSDRNIVRVWDANLGSLLLMLEGHSSSGTSVVFSPDGAKIAESGSFEETVWIWDAHNGTLISILEGHSNMLASVAFSHDGAKIASGSNDTVRIWDAHYGTVMLTLEGHSQRVMSVAFSPDSTKIASGSHDNTVRVWDANIGTLISTRNGHSESVICVAFSLDGSKIASGSRDHTVRIWDADNGTLISTLEGHSSWVTSVAFLPNKRHVISSSYNEQLIWDIPSQSSLAVNSSATKLSPNALVPPATRADVVFAWSASSGWISSHLGSQTLTHCFWVPEGLRHEELRAHGGTVVLYGPRGMTILDLSAIAPAVH